MDIEIKATQDNHVLENLHVKNYSILFSSLLYFLMFTETYWICSHLMQLGDYTGKSKNRSQGFHYLYLEAVSIQNSKSQSTNEDLQDTNPKARPAELLDLFSFSSRDLEFIMKFSMEHGSDLFRQILQSIRPSIYGHELVKGMSMLHIQWLKMFYLWMAVSKLRLQFFYL